MLRRELEGKGSLMPVDSLDMFDILDRIAKSGDFANVTSPCIDNSSALASDCAGYLFFDNLHPTAVAHEMTAGFALATIPEPSTWAMAGIGFAALGLITRRKRREARQLA